MLIVVVRNWGRLIFILVLLIIIIDVFQIGLLTTAKVVIATVSGRLVPVYFVSTHENKVSFTFEGASGNDMTGEILKVLEDHSITATFFLSGEWIDKHKDSVDRIVAGGHDLGNYTYSVPHPNSLTEGRLKQELEKAHKCIKKITGRLPEVFRPPYGEYSNKVIEVSRELGYETVVWSIDSLDWRGISPDRMNKRILEKLHKGAIIRFHITEVNTPNALSQIIENIKKQGYKIVPLTELLLEGNHYIHPHTGEMRPIRMPSTGLNKEGLSDEA
ncbi:MAG: polysaccharide deacetylase family protein [Firmicutes bacterium]|nr:polysaccharide deacetylase family protein [Bacillota bacterium]